jgi:hypothetical protein
MMKKSRFFSTGYTPMSLHPERSMKVVSLWRRNKNGERIHKEYSPRNTIP